MGQYTSTENMDINAYIAFMRATFEKMSTDEFMRQLQGKTDFDNINFDWANAENIPREALSNSIETIKGVLYKKKDEGSYVVIVNDNSVFYKNYNKLVKNNIDLTYMALSPLLLEASIQGSPMRRLYEQISKSAYSETDIEREFIRDLEFARTSSLVDDHEISIHVIIQTRTKHVIDGARLLCYILSSRNHVKNAKTKLLVTLSDALISPNIPIESIFQQACSFTNTIKCDSLGIYGAFQFQDSENQIKNMLSKVSTMATEIHKFSIIGLESSKDLQRLKLNWNDSNGYLGLPPSDFVKYQQHDNLLSDYLIDSQIWMLFVVPNFTQQYFIDRQKLFFYNLIQYLQDLNKEKINKLKEIFTRPRNVNSLIYSILTQSVRINNDKESMDVESYQNTNKHLTLGIENAVSAQYNDDRRDDGLTNDQYITITNLVNPAPNRKGSIFNLETIYGPVQRQYESVNWEVFDDNRINAGTNVLRTLLKEKEIYSFGNAHKRIIVHPRPYLLIPARMIVCPVTLYGFGYNLNTDYLVSAAGVDFRRKVVEQTKGYKDGIVNGSTLLLKSEGKIYSEYVLFLFVDLPTPSHMTNNHTESIILNNAYKSLFDMIELCNVKTVSVELLGTIGGERTSHPRHKQSIDTLMKYFESYQNNLNIYLSCSSFLQASLMKVIQTKLNIYDNDSNNFNVNISNQSNYSNPTKSFTSSTPSIPVSSLSSASSASSVRKKTVVQSTDNPVSNKKALVINKANRGMNSSAQSSIPSSGPSFVQNPGGGTKRDEYVNLDNDISNLLKADDLYKFQKIQTLVQGDSPVFAIHAHVYKQHEDNHLFICHGSVPLMKADKLVNAANFHGLGGSGIDGEFMKRGGDELREARLGITVKGKKKIKGETFNVRILEGDCEETKSGGDLKCLHVIHACPPDYKKYADVKDADAVLHKTIESVYKKAFSGGLGITLGMCLLSNGIFANNNKEGVTRLNLGYNIECLSNPKVTGKRIFLVAYNQDELKWLLSELAENMSDYSKKYGVHCNDFNGRVADPSTTPTTQTTYSSSLSMHDDETLRSRPNPMQSDLSVIHEVSSDEESYKDARQFGAYEDSYNRELPPYSDMIGQSSTISSEMKDPFGTSAKYDSRFFGNDSLMEYGSGEEEKREIEEDDKLELYEDIDSASVLADGTNKYELEMALQDSLKTAEEEEKARKYQKGTYATKDYSNYYEDLDNYAGDDINLNKSSTRSGDFEDPFKGLSAVGVSSSQSSYFNPIVSTRVNTNPTPGYLPSINMNPLSTRTRTTFTSFTPPVQLQSSSITSSTPYSTNMFNPPSLNTSVNYTPGSSASRLSAINQSWKQSGNFSSQIPNPSNQTSTGSTQFVNPLKTSSATLSMTPSVTPSVTPSTVPSTTPSTTASPAIIPSSTDPNKFSMPARRSSTATVNKQSTLPNIVPRQNGNVRVPSSSSASSFPRVAASSTTLNTFVNPLASSSLSSSSSSYRVPGSLNTSNTVVNLADNDNESVYTDVVPSYASGNSEEPLTETEAAIWCSKFIHINEDIFSTQYGRQLKKSKTSIKYKIGNTPMDIVAASDLHVIPVIKYYGVQDKFLNSRGKIKNAVLRMRDSDLRIKTQHIEEDDDDEFQSVINDDDNAMNIIPVFSNTSISNPTLKRAYVGAEKKPVTNPVINPTTNPINKPLGDSKPPMPQLSFLQDIKNRRENSDGNAKTLFNNQNPLSSGTTPVYPSTSKANSSVTKPKANSSSSKKQLESAPKPSLIEQLKTGIGSLKKVGIPEDTNNKKVKGETEENDSHPFLNALSKKISSIRKDVKYESEDEDDKKKKSKDPDWGF